jgi:hypothetical protein
MDTKNECIQELYEIQNNKDANKLKYNRNKIKTKTGSRPPSPRWHLEGKIQRKYINKIDYLNEDFSLINYRPTKLRMKKKDSE